jgi:hypothetical protein
MFYLLALIANDLVDMCDPDLVYSNSHAFVHTYAIDHYIPNRHQSKHGDYLVVLVWNIPHMPVPMQRNLLRYMNLKTIRFQPDWLNK